MHTGILKWNGFNYKTATISDLPIHIPLNIGDTIITNSYSKIYPEGINIGTITNFKKNDDGFYTVDVGLFQDFNCLKYAYVVHSKETKEQLEKLREVAEASLTKTEELQKVLAQIEALMSREESKKF